MATGDARWRRDATAAARFVEAMWSPECACFAAGTGVDGVTRNSLLALDAQVWPLLAIPGAAARYRSAIGTVVKRLSAGDGFAYSEAGTGLWTEGTAQMQLLYTLLGQQGPAAALRAAVAAESDLETEATLQRGMQVARLDLPWSAIRACRAAISICRTWVPTHGPPWPSASSIHSQRALPCRRRPLKSSSTS